MSINSDIPFLERSKISMSENSRSFMNISMFNNTRLGHCRLLHRRHLDVLGLSFSTHSRILFSSELFSTIKYLPLAARYNWCQGPVPGRGPAVAKHCSWSQCGELALGEVGEALDLSWDRLLNEWIDVKKLIYRIFLNICTVYPTKLYTL
jgi:hypothetical protein